MDKNIVLGGLAGGFIMLIFTLGPLLLLTSVSSGSISGLSNGILGLLPILLAPVGGGFLAGLIGRSDPHLAGSIAGIIASVFMIIAWLVIVGFSLQTLIAGAVIAFMWIVLARLAAGFAKPRSKSK